MLNKSAIAATLFILSLSTTSMADQVFTDDVIIQDDLCVGSGCADGELFPSRFQLKLKGAAIGIYFDDTTAANTDWNILPNNGGSNELYIEDATAGTIPFTIKGGAPSDALFVAANGNVGIGTSLPQGEQHISSSGAVNVHLTSGAGSPHTQTWEISSGITGIFFQDRTGGGAFSFGIENGAPENSLRVAPNGNVGLGLSNPAVPLHVVENAGTATDVMRLENNGGVVFRLKDTSPGGQEFTFQSNGGIFRIASPAVPGPEFTMDDFGNVTIKGEITTAGSCSGGCDRVFDPDYDLKPLAQHNALMWEQGYLPNVGPTAESGPMNLSDKVGGMLNELEHAHIYIGQLHQEIAALKSGHAAELDALRQEQAEQAQALNELRTLLTAK